MDFVGVEHLTVEHGTRSRIESSRYFEFEEDREYVLVVVDVPIIKCQEERGSRERRFSFRCCDYLGHADECIVSAAVFELLAKQVHLKALDAGIRTLEDGTHVMVHDYRQRIRQLSQQRFLVG